MANLNRFDEQLDKIIQSDDALQSALNSNNSLLRAAARLTNNRHPVLAPSVRQAIWSNLTQVLPRASASNMIRPNFTAWMARIAAIFVIATLLGLAAQPIAADSLPGEALYPVKRAFEQLELTFARSPEAQVAAHLNHAEERLLEIQELSPDSEFLEATLGAASASLEDASAIASENAVFEQDSALAEQAESSAINIEQILASTPLSSEFASNLQATIETVRSQIPLSANIDSIISPEVTESAPEATPEVSIEAEVTPEVTEIVPELTPEASSESVDESVATEEAVDVIASEATTMYIHPDGRVNVRSEADSNSDIVGTANQNTPVTVLSQNAAGDWFEVRLPNGLEGWILADLLDDTPGQSDNSNDNANGNANGNNNGNANGSGNGNANGSGRGN